MTKIKPVFRTPEQVYDLWIAALRSGKYEQGVRLLKNGSRYCCLGVLCNLSVKDGGSGFFMGNCFYMDDTCNACAHICAPPHEMTDYLGISETQLGHLMRMNDRDGKTFEEIADYIENVLKPQALASI